MSVKARNNNNPAAPATGAPMPTNGGTVAPVDREELLRDYVMNNGAYLNIGKAVTEHRRMSSKSGFDPNKIGAALYNSMAQVSGDIADPREAAIMASFEVLLKNRAVTPSYLEKVIARTTPHLTAHRDNVLGILGDNHYRTMALRVVQQPSAYLDLHTKLTTDPSIKRVSTLSNLLKDLQKDENEGKEEMAGKFYDTVSEADVSAYTKSGKMSDADARQYIQKGREMFLEGLKGLQSAAARHEMYQMMLGLTGKQIESDARKINIGHVKGTLSGYEPATVLSLLSDVVSGSRQSYQQE